MLLEHWDLIENDLADRGIDVGDDLLMAARSWRWLRSRILGLLSAPAAHDLMGGTTFTTRLQAALAPPPADTSVRPTAD